ncbi:MAG: IS1634 family transposase [Gaiellaceae bacterium]
MFLKETTVRRGERSYTYVQLVEGYRDEAGRVRQRVVANLGRKERLKDSGQAEALAAAFARLDPPMAGTRREVGALLLVRHFCERLGLRAAVERLLPARGRAELSVGEVIEALVVSRLCSPSPLYDVSGWASGTALQELFGVPAQLLNDDRLGRALEALAPKAEALRGALALRASEGFGLEAARLHLDLTTLRVAGAYEDSALVRKGWGADRRVARQVRTLQASTPEGVALYLRPDPGSASELALIGAGLQRLRELLKPGLVVADSALGHLRSLCQAERAGLCFLVPLRADTGFSERFLAEVGLDRLRPLRYVSERERALPPKRRIRYRGALRDFCVTDPETGDARSFRVAYIHSSEEEREVAAARERALAKATEALERVRRGLGGRHYKTREQVDARVARILAGGAEGLIEVETATRGGRPTLSFARDEAAIERAAATDGVYALATNLPGRLTATKLLRLYKQQWIVEQRHRDLKQTLKARPIFLHNDDRIAALVSVIGIALLVFGLIESELRRRLGEDEVLPGLLGEGRAAKPTGRNLLAAFQGLGITYTRQGIALDRLTQTQRRILELLEIELPWPELGELAA